MAPIQTTLPTPALVVPAGLAQDILRKTGAAVTFFEPDGPPADSPASHLAREALVRGEDPPSELAGEGVLRAAWLLGPRGQARMVAVAELTLASGENLDLGRRLLAAVGETVRARVREAVTREENEAASESLLQSFEEVSLLHHLGEILRVNRSEEDLLQQVCLELRETIGAQAAAAYLPPMDGNGPRTILAGRLPFALETLPRLVDRLLGETGPESSLLINNHCQEDPALAGLARTLERVVLVPLPLRENVRGALAAINRTGEEFGSPDAKLIRSAASASAIFIENRRLYRELQELMLDLVRALVSSIDAKDPYTCGHSERVALTCRRVAGRMGVAQDEIEVLYLAGLLHDVGKIGTPEHILRKAGKLEPEEYRIIQQHSEVGSNILSGVRKLGHIREAVLLHHERLDGTGYPRGLKGDQIPLLARILGLADAFDAMSSNRPYRPRMPLDRVRAEIERCSGTQFDSRAAEALLGMDLEQLLEELASRPTVSVA